MRKGFGYGLDRAQHFKKVYKLLDRWDKGGNIETSIQVFTSGILKLSGQTRFEVVKFASTFMKRYLKRLRCKNGRNFIASQMQ